MADKQRGGVYGTAEKILAFLTNRSALAWASAGERACRRVTNSANSSNAPNASAIHTQPGTLVVRTVGTGVSHA